MEEQNLIEALTEFIKWNGVRFSHNDELLPNKEQPENVEKVIILLTELVG